MKTKLAIFSLGIALTGVNVVGAASQRLIRTGERSGLLTHIVTMGSGSLCTPMKS
jgi:hypothetical protein